MERWIICQFLSQTIDAFEAGSNPGDKEKPDASSELQSALKGILTAVSSQLKTLQKPDASRQLRSALKLMLSAAESERKTSANDDDEDVDDKEDGELEVVVTLKKDPKEVSSVKEESETKTGQRGFDVSGGRLATRC